MFNKRYKVLRGRLCLGVKLTGINNNYTIIDELGDGDKSN